MTDTHEIDDSILKALGDVLRRAEALEVPLSIPEGDKRLESDTESPTSIEDAIVAGRVRLSRFSLRHRPKKGQKKYRRGPRRRRKAEYKRHKARENTENALYRGTPRGKYVYLRKNCKTRKIEFDLDYEYFHWYVTKNTYRDIEIYKLISNYNFKIVRLDTSKGYSKSNICIVSLNKNSMYCSIYYIDTKYVSLDTIVTNKLISPTPLRVGEIYKY